MGRREQLMAELDRRTALKAELSRRQSVQPETIPEKGFIDRVSEGVTKRGEKFGSDMEQIGKDITSFNPLVSLPAGQRAIERVGGVVAGAAGDVIGEGLTSVGEGISSITPDSIKQPIKEIGTKLIESKFGKAVADAIRGGSESFAVFEKENPEVAQDVKDVFNIGLMVAPIKGGSGIKAAAKKTLDPALESALTKGKVLTSDVIPPKTFVGKSLQKLTERVPVIGTGSLRKAQQASRVDSLENIAKEFGIDQASNFEKEIIDSANKVFKGSQKRAGELRNQAVEQLDKVGNVTPSNAISEINSQLSKIKNMGVRGDKELSNTLRNIKQELTGNFSRMIEQRTTIFNDISDIAGNKNAIKSGGDSVLTKIAGSLSKDLDEFASKAGKASGENRDLAKAAGKWKASNRIFKDNFAKARDTELKKALTKGKVQPEVINSTIRGGKQSELRRLHGNLDLDGRKAVKQQILKSALEKANGNPTIFLNELNRVNNKRAISTFFKGKSRNEIEGLKKFLDMTRRSQEAGASIASQSEVSTLGLLGGAALAPKPVLGAAATIGVLGRVYESKAVRDLLLKLSLVPKGSKKAKESVSKIRALLSASAESAKVNGQENE